MRNRHFQSVGIFALAAALLLGLLLLFRVRLLSPAAASAARSADFSVLIWCVMALFTAFGLLMLHWESKGIRQAEAQAERLRMAAVKYKILESLCGCGVFCLELATGTLTVSPSLEAALERRIPTANAPESIISGNFIWEEDISNLSSLSQEALLRVPADGSLTREIRLITADGRPVWYQLRVSSIQNCPQKPVLLLGTLTDIDDVKQRQRGVIEKVKRDPMTGLYNKFAIQELADACLREEGQDMIYALFILDLDNFRHVNDTYGHIVGDQILCDLSRKLQRMFRQDDIIARIGGDEFAVLMKHAASHRTVRDKARQVCTALEAIQVNEQSPGTISASIGISLFPRDGETYISLLEKADAALYYVKDNGKRHYKIYGEATDERVGAG